MNVASLLEITSKFYRDTASVNIPAVTALQEEQKICALATFLSEAPLSRYVGATLRRTLLDSNIF